MTTPGNAGISPEAVSQLVTLLAEELKHFTSVEIAETLWLAMQMEPAATVVPNELLPLKSPPPLPPIPSEPIGEPELPPPLPPEKPSRAKIAAPTPQAVVLPPQVLPVYLADPAMLTDSLAIVRALKPLLQKVAAGPGKQLDETATVDNIARARLCLPILKPEQEPWFEIILVVDRGSSMHIWQRLVKDVVRMLRRYGAFRNVQVFDLVVDQSGVQLISNPQRPGHRPSELIDQRGRRIAIVLSDCAGAYWWDGTLLPMFQAWGKIMPTVIWQMLPPWMWKRTALGRGTAVAIGNDIPGAANQRLKTQVQERHEPEDRHQRLAVPVVTSEVRDLARWSLMLAGDRREITPGFLLPAQPGGSVPRSKGMEEIARARAKQALDEGRETDSDTAFNQSLDILARDRVDRFLELSSPEAQRLIMLLAAAPVITLPVVRLIRDAMLYEAQSPLPVAEVFLSGLLQRLPDQEDRALERVLQEESERMQATLELQSLTQQEEGTQESLPLDQQDLVQYDFAPQVRKTLLTVLPAVDTIEVINTVSAAVEKRWNQFSSQDFRAFLMDPTSKIPEGLAGLRSFASVTAEILEQLGGAYADLAQQLRQGTVPPSPDPALEEANFPELEPFEFIDAQLIDGAEPTFPPLLHTETFTVITLQAQQVSEPSQSHLEPFEFTVARLVQQQANEVDPTQLNALDTEDPTEWVVQRQPQRAYRFVEHLYGDLPLEMVAIPAGTFLMGSPEDEPERYDAESPQHDVTIAAFFMGRYPITQAQWRTVTHLPQVKQALDPEPSQFKGDDRPVEQVSWDDAVEFCARLSILTKRQYRLPTEAEWEYACRASPIHTSGTPGSGEVRRAGTTTPFHFGDMITTEVTNYNGSAYAEGAAGTSRGETTPVDAFGIANAFGLSEMHGNVWEWCQDHWHGNYKGLPTDGSAWLTKNERAGRVRHGGSWRNHPRQCRSASRSNRNPGNRDNDVGFRVCCSGPRTL